MILGEPCKHEFPEGNCLRFSGNKARGQVKRKSRVIKQRHVVTSSKEGRIRGNIGKGRKEKSHVPVEILSRPIDISLFRSLSLSHLYTWTTEL